jgi:transposase
MTESSKVQPRVTAGLDMGDKYSYPCASSIRRAVRLWRRVGYAPPPKPSEYASEQPLRIAIETGTHSPWASRVLRRCGHEMLVANARKLRLIYASKRKTDEIDAENLTHLARLDPKLLYPLKHRGEESQAHMAIIRSRQALVDCRTQLVNHLRGAGKSVGARLPKCEGKEFPQKSDRAHPRGALAGFRTRP